MADWRHSIALRLSLAFALLATVVFAALGFYFSRAADAHMAELDAHDLFGKLALIGHVGLHEKSADAFNARLGDALIGEHGVIVTVDGKNGPLFKWPTPALAEPLAAARVALGPSAVRLVLGGAEYRVIAAEMETAWGGTVQVAVARDIRHHTDFLDQLQHDFWLATGSVAFTRMAPDSVPHWLILAGFLVNAGAVPLSAWLPDAYPEASWSGTVFLSAFTTKTAVYVLIRGFPGTELLIWVGLAMVFYGIIYALLENDMRRILAYSIVNQVGFMIAGIGIGTEMALNGAAAHAFTHIIYKALLLMSAGSVLLMTNRRKCSELGGLFHTMPLTTVCGTIGALAISSFPLTSGFVSKSMVSQAAADGHLLTVWLLLTAASAGVFLHAGIKFPWFVFFQKDSGLRPAEPPASMRWAMVFFAFLCIALGVWAEPLYALLPYEVKYEPYTWAHVLTQTQLLLFSGLAFFVMLPYLKRTLTITLDTDWVWRRLLPGLLRAFTPLLSATRHAAGTTVKATVQAAQATVERTHGLDSRLAKTWPTGRMGLAVLILLLGYLLLYYL